MPATVKLKDRQQVLVVEGYSDLLFYAEMLESVGRPNAVFIQNFNGKEDLLLKLEDFITPQLLQEKTRIGVILDADGNAGGTYTRVREVLQMLTGQVIPEAGRWSEGNPKIGVYVTPDGINNGEIETLVWNSWAQDPINDLQRTCVQAFIECMEGHGVAAHSRDKGLISALLSIRYDEDPRLGPGARGNVFDLTRPEFARLRSFFSAFDP